MVGWIEVENIEGQTRPSILWWMPLGFNVPGVLELEGVSTHAMWTGKIP